MSDAVGQTMDLTGSTLAGKYKLTGLLGEGAMGAVYSATTPEGRSVAVKTLLSEARKQLGDEALARFVREAQVSSQLKSPHVVEVIDAGHDEQADVAFMVMELLKGEDLDQVLSRTGALPQQIAVRLVLQAARGLAAAHAQGIVHRDVKPSNIFVHREGEQVTVKVCDFGIAKEQAQGPEQGLTQTGSVLGSPMYMSPEQLLNAKKADHRADIWGLAMSAFDALAGEPALKDVANLPALVMALARQDVRLLSDAAPWCPPGLSTALEQALRRDPAKRYETMDAFIEALLPFCGGSEEVKTSELVSIDPAEKRKMASLPAVPQAAAAPAKAHASNLTPERYVGQTLVKRYVLQRLLRQGADGWIFDARTANSGRPCHLRLVPRHLVGSSREAEELAERAKAARDLRHPHQVRVLDAGVDPISGMPFVVFEPCEGRSLAEIIHERGKLTLPEVASVGLQLARALDTLHKSGSQHGAVRSGAIHVIEKPGPAGEPSLVVQLSGWGEAKLSFEPLSEGEQVSPLARSMAPEQARESGREVSPRTDAWGLSVVLFEALCGRHPLAAYNTMGDLILGICVHEAPKLNAFEPRADAGMVELVGRGLQRNADKRPASMAEFEKVLAQKAGTAAAWVIEHEPLPPKAIAPVPAASAPDKKNNSVILAAVIGLLVIVTVAVAMTQMR